MPLCAYLTPKVDFKRKFNHHQSFLYELTARTIRKFRIGPSLRIESRIGLRFEIESNHEASQVPTIMGNLSTEKCHQNLSATGLPFPFERPILASF